MAIIKGQNLRLFINSVAIAAATQCEIHMRLNVQSKSTKDDTDDWTVNEAVSQEWDCRTTGLVTIDPDRNDPASLTDRIGQEVEVQFAVAGGTKNSDIEDLLMVGRAIIADVQLTAQNRSDSVYTVSLTGNGDLMAGLGELVSSNDYLLVTSNGKSIVVQMEPE